MAKSPLILAALAKDAVPQLDFVQAVPLTHGHGNNFDSAVLTATDGSHYVIRQARNEAAAMDLDTEIVVLRALAPFRGHFPFEITKLIGETRDQAGNRAQLFSFVYGEHTELGNQPGTSPLATSLANALAAIHSLPLSVVENNGLPSFTAESVVRDRVADLDRAAQTGRIPAVLLNRWERALEDVSLWRFQPAVVHGDANVNNFITLDESVSGVLGWHNLRISDPALDFAWIQGMAPADFSYSVLLEYERLRGADENLRARAELYSELELARFLVWGITNNDAETIADGEQYINEIAADVESGLRGPIGPKPLGVDAPAFTDAPSFMDTSQAVVSDSLFFSPAETRADDFDATAPIEIVSEVSYVYDDKTAPIPVVAQDDVPEEAAEVIAEAEESEEAPKNGELF